MTSIEWAWNTRKFFATASLKAVKARLDAGADPTARDGDGFTPLHCTAIAGGDPAIVEALIAVGADPNAESAHGLTPLHVAWEHWWSAGDADAALVRTLLVGGANANAAARRWEGKSALHLATRSARDPEIVKALIAGGADPNVRDEDGETPLHDAAHEENPMMTDALLEAGADPNACDGDGATPLHAAVFNVSPAALEALLKAGADPDIRDGEGRTPADLAASTALRTESIRKVLRLLGEAARARPKAERQADGPRPGT